MHSLHTHMHTQIQEDIAKVFLVTAVILLCVRLFYFPSYFILPKALVLTTVFTS